MPPPPGGHSQCNRIELCLSEKKGKTVIVADMSFSSRKSNKVNRNNIV